MNVRNKKDFSQSLKVPLKKKEEKDLNIYKCIAN